MWNLFSQENPVGRTLSRIVDLVILNILYLVFCLPLFTIGAATSALYYVTVRMADKTYVSPLRDFWKGFRDNFKAITPIWLVALVYGALVGTVFGLNHQRIWGAGHAGWIYIVLTVVSVLVVMLCEWLFALQMRFENTRRELLKNAALFLVRFLPSLLLIEVVHALFLLLVFSNMSYWPVTFVCGFSLPALVKGYYFSRIFNKIIAVIQPDALVTDPKDDDKEPDGEEEESEQPENI